MAGGIVHGGDPAIVLPTLPGVLAWVMPDQGVTTSSGNVTVAASQSGGGINFTNSGTVPWSATALNGHPAFNFGGAGALVTGAADVAWGTGSTGYFCCVAQMSAATGGFGGLSAFISNQSAEDEDWVYPTSASIVSRSASTEAIESTRSTVFTVPREAAITYDTPFSVVVTYDCAAMPSTAHGLYINGIAVASEVTSAAFAALGKLILGGRSADGTGNPTNFWTGPVGDAVWGNGQFTPTNLTDWESYRVAKYI